MHKPVIVTNVSLTLYFGLLVKGNVVWQKAVTAAHAMNLLSYDPRTRTRSQKDCKAKTSETEMSL